MEIKIIKEKISLEEVKKMAEEQYNNMIKAVVDIEKEIMAIGGELHSDANELLSNAGSDQKNVWGINIFPGKSREEWIEFNSLINIKPKEGNLDMDIKLNEVKNKIEEIVNKLIV
jgi:hypothetical protein